MNRFVLRLNRLPAWVFGWIRHRFTPAGHAVLVGLAVSAMSGFDTEKSLTHQVFAVLLALVLVALVGSAGFRMRFTVERRLPRHGSVGLPIRYGVIVRSESPRAQIGLTVREQLGEDATQGEGRRSRGRWFRGTAGERHVVKVGEGALPTLLPGGEAEAMVELVPARRGVIRLEGVTLARADPLGLFRAFANRAHPGQVLVLPKRYALPPIGLPGTSRYQQGGVAMAGSVGQSDEFVSLRDYRPGDPLRHVHWKSWARTGRPIVKEFEDEFFVRHALILDTFQVGPGGAAFEEAVSVAASFACTVQTQESLLDLLFVGLEAYCFTAGRGVGQTEQLLEVLAGVRVCETKPFASLSHLVLNHVRAVSGCVVILLDWDEPRRELVRRMRALQVSLVVLVVVESGRAAALRAVKETVEGVWILEVGKIEEGLARLT